MWATVLILVPVVTLGLLAGRFPWLLVLAVVPLVIAWVWYDQNFGGPDDDVTGPVATVIAVLGTGIFLGSAALSWAVRRIWRRTHPDRTET